MHRSLLILLCLAALGLAACAGGDAGMSITDPAAQEEANRNWNGPD